MPETMTKTEFELIDYLPAHAIDIIVQGAREPGLEVNKQTIDWAGQMLLHGPCTTGIYNDRIVACGGIWINWPGVGEQWALNVLDIGDCHIDPQKAKQWMYDHIDEHKLWRLQVPARSDFPEAEKYLQWLGFTLETRLEKYHTDGTDALMYKIITEKYLPTG